MEEFENATLCTYRTVKFWGITCITKIFSFAYTAQWYTANMKFCCVQDCRTNNTTAGVPSGVLELRFAVTNLPKSRSRCCETAADRNWKHAKQIETGNMRLNQLKLNVHCRL